MDRKKEVIQELGFNFIFFENNDCSDGWLEVCKVQRECVKRHFLMDLTGVIISKSCGHVSSQIGLSSLLRLPSIPQIHCFFRSESAIYVVYQPVNLDKSLFNLAQRAKFSMKFLGEILHKVKQFVKRLQDLGLVLLRLNPRTVFEEKNSILIYGLKDVVRKGETSSAVFDAASKTILGSQELKEYPPELSSAGKAFPLSDSQTLWALAKFVRFLFSNCDKTELEGDGHNSYEPAIKGILDGKVKLGLSDFLELIKDQKFEDSSIRKTNDPEQLEEKKTFVKPLIDKLLLPKISKINMLILKILLIEVFAMKNRKERQSWESDYSKEIGSHLSPQMRYLIQEFNTFLSYNEPGTLSDEKNYLEFTHISNINQEFLKEGCLELLEETKKEPREKQLEMEKRIRNLLLVQNVLNVAKKSFQAGTFVRAMEEQADSDLSKLKAMMDE